MLTLAYGLPDQEILCPHRDEVVPDEDVTITILDADGSVVLEGTATKGTLATTLAAAASPNSRSIQLTDASALEVGEPFILTDALGRTELCVAQGVDVVTDTVALRDRLARSYASGDSADSALIRYIADLSTTTWLKGSYYQAIFECDDWSSARALVFRIVDLETQNPLTFDDVRQWVPHVSVIRDSYDSPELLDARDLAWVYLKSQLEADGRDPATWRDPSSSSTIKAAGGCLAAGFFLLFHGQAEISEKLIGDPPGAGGVFAQLWAAISKTPSWNDSNQDRAISSQERRRPRTTLVGRGL